MAQAEGLVGEFFVEFCAEGRDYACVDGPAGGCEGETLLPV